MASDSRKRPAAGGPYQYSVQKIPGLMNKPPPTPTETPRRPPCKPTIVHRPHPDSKLCQDFHWIPYPLGLMPYDSWAALHSPPESSVLDQREFRCPVCRKNREMTPHCRKLFLVAERLTFEDGMVSNSDRNQNEEMNWTVNYELGILDPFVEDPEHVPGGNKSQTNKWHPYRNEFEMKQVLSFIFRSENITEVQWALWIGLQMDLQHVLRVREQENTQQACRREPCSPPRKMSNLKTPERTREITPASAESIDLTESPDRAPDVRNYSFGMPTPPSSWKGNHSAKKSRPSLQTCPQPTSTLASTPSLPAGFPKTSSHTLQPNPSKGWHIASYRTLQDFYSLLDKIERSSYVGARFLEAYAEHLRDDMCRNCWLQHNVASDIVR
ncbi:hypothetical protein BDV96DRAFT_599017 [Lophiotrema nucula]|uniref:Uncharacterized protein n=1 Tax=Lophiotrema nucula TaxID=690887 RepID=A0A6A5ZA16_9PLEO|nr:hypothetical protein BDV96DRAFT_599017 [Lophiotrema nucula]